MCLTIPGKIKSISKGIALVENGQRTARIDLSLVFDVKVGDWVLYATDRAVKKISEEDAKEIITLLEEKYRPIDNSKLPKKFVDLLTKITRSEYLTTKGGQRGDKRGTKGRQIGSQTKGRQGRQKRDKEEKKEITKKEIEYLLSLEDPDCLETLYSEANVLRKSTIEDFVCIHGIIEFSNYCRNNCLYCGIRADQKIKRYRMNADEIFETAKRAVEEEGYKLIVLQSGEDLFYSDLDLINIIKKIKKSLKVFIFISVGERSREFYKKAWMAGATGSLFRFETSSPDLYVKMHPKHKLDNRLQLIRYQRELGYYIASGSLVGLPGQTISDIANDLLMIKKLNIPMISAGPWLKAIGTPLASYKLQVTSYKERQIKLFLKYIAVARFIMPEIKIPVTTALETLDPENGRHRGLLAGANALMFNLTPEKYAGKYSIYDNKYREREKVWQKYGLFKGEESWEMLEKRLMIDDSISC